MEYRKYSGTLKDGDAFATKDGGIIFYTKAKDPATVASFRLIAFCMAELTSKKS